MVAAVDASFFLGRIIAVASQYEYPGLRRLEDTFAVQEVRFPYIPGYLSFRECPAMIRALKDLTKKPDVILCDGQGIAHPRSFGIASHLGLITGMPTIGCAKSRLVGDYQEPGRQKGNWASLRSQGKEVGAVLRTRDSVKPLFVSPGYLIDLASSIEIVLGCSLRYRIPEPLRRADSLSGSLTREFAAGMLQVKHGIIR